MALRSAAEQAAQAWGDVGQAVPETVGDVRRDARVTDG